MISLLGLGVAGFVQPPNDLFFPGGPRCPFLLPSRLRLDFTTLTSQLLSSAVFVFVFFVVVVLVVALVVEIGIIYVSIDVDRIRL